MNDKNFETSILKPIVKSYYTTIEVTDTAQLPLFSNYSYPYNNSYPMYYFNNKYIFAFIDKI